ncbi:isopentenyl-diphosphate Delta-isomerase [Pseudoruegeria sp. HB172150]|uniref:isopentenyl-diphosphate Delta-isomerase n=1 Tax=Pseudoruegeria sp. HB172150 TaxID=2721164 RepID=UPI0015560AF4|nr:isopentenyl-diphosphate Delta-isomerase [Pseudoruegeria sp. HB172150]
MQEMIPAWVNGELVPAEKVAAHREGLRHKAVSVFVVADGRTLIQRRSLEKYHTPGLWANTCCTHPRWGEADADCAVRRLEQELGITGLRPEYRGEVRYRADVGNGMVEDEVVQVYLCAAGPDLQVVPKPQEVMETRWVGLPELEAEIAAEPERFTPWLRIYLAEHSGQILGNM